MPEKGHPVKKIIKNSSGRCRTFRFRKEEQGLNASLPWYRLTEGKPLPRGNARGELDLRKRERKGLDMIPSSFFRMIGRRWPSFPSKQRIGLAIEERP